MSLILTMGILWKKKSDIFFSSSSNQVSNLKGRFVSTRGSRCRPVLSTDEHFVPQELTVSHCSTKQK